MKSIVLGLVILVCGTIQAQTQGEVKYQTKINLHAGLPDDKNSEMLKKMLPEFEKVNNVLLFTETESLFKSETSSGSLEDNEELLDEDDNVKIKIEMDSPETSIYTNVKNGVVIEQRDLMGKKFLITDTLKQADWKITGETKSFSGFQCQKAELISPKDTVIAWYTSEIAISTGPSGFGGLPGLIVSVSMDNGNYTINATQLIKRDVNEKEIKAPTKGKKITNEAFNKLQEEKMKEMQEQFGGDGGNVIIINE